MRAVLVLIFATGCGRVGFGDDVIDGRPDAVPCVPVGHDEDGDGIDDACDGCPHLADPAQPDQDFDGVDDACDPHVAQPIDHIAFFDPFIATRPELTYESFTPTFAGDSLIDMSTTSSDGLTFALVPSHDRIEIAGHFGAVGAGTHGFNIAASDGSRIYYCELFESPPATYSITYYDGTAYTHITDWPSSSIQNGDFMLQFTMEPPDVECLTTWPASGSALAGVVPIQIDATTIHVTFLRTAVELDYFLHIHWN